MIVLLVAVVVAVAWTVSLVSGRLRLPDVLAFLVLGLALGPFGTGLLRVGITSPAIGTILTLAAAVLLYDGGRGIELSHLRRGSIGLTLLVTVGVLVTAGLTAAAGRQIFGWGGLTAALLGAVLAGTDPAAVIPIMRQAGIAERISQVAQAESALNDAASAMLTLVVLETAAGHGIAAGRIAAAVVGMGGGGILVGAAVATATAWAAYRIGPRRWDLGAHDQQVLELTTVLLAYGLATLLGGGGLIAAFTAGAVHRAMIPEESRSTAPFFSTLGFVARLTVFLILGATLDPARAVQPLGATLLFIAAFMFFIRPAAVVASILPDRRGGWSTGEFLLLSWVRETGVIPAVLAAYLSSLAVPHAGEIEAKVAAVIFATVIVQGLTTGMVARALRLTPRRPGPSGSTRESAGGAGG